MNNIAMDEKEKCPVCGSSLDEIVNASRMGCANCYDFFSEPINYIIESVQFITPAKHVGRTPESYIDSKISATGPAQLASEISDEMRVKIREEKYEDAAELNSILKLVTEILSTLHDGFPLSSEHKKEINKITRNRLMKKINQEPPSA